MTFQPHPISIFAKSFHYISYIIDNFKGELTTGDRKKLAEAGRYLFQFYDSDIANKEDASIIHQWIDRIVHVLASDLYSANEKIWQAFRYFHRNFPGNPYGQIAITESFVLSILAQEVSKNPINWDASIIKELPEYHFEKYLTNLDTLIKRSEHRVQLMFLLLNTIDMLGVINDQTKFSDLYALSKHLASSVDTELVQYYTKIPTLPILADSIKQKHALQITQPPQPICSDDDLFLCLLRLNRDEDISLPLRTNSDSVKRPYLWWIIQAWENARKGGNLYIVPYTDCTDLDAVSNLVWNGLDSILSQPEPTEVEIDCLRELSDKEIKELLYEFFMRHPRITTSSKLNLPTERDKSHGPGEISDFNVEFVITRGPLQVCIVIKSGKESRTTAPEKITLDNIHQILKPSFTFVKFSVVVLALIIKESTLNATEFYTYLRHRREIPVALFDVSFFHRLLKREGLGSC